MPYLAEKALPGRARADCHSAAEAILPALHNAQLWQDFNLGRLDDARAGARALTELGQEHVTVVVDQEAERDNTHAGTVQHDQRQHACFPGNDTERSRRARYWRARFWPSLSRGSR
jgi:hypothetical protein